MLVLGIKVNLKSERDVFYISVASLKKIIQLIQNLLKKRKLHEQNFRHRKKKLAETLYCLEDVLHNISCHVITVSRLTCFMHALELSNDVRTHEKCEVA